MAHMYKLREYIFGRLFLNNLKIIKLKIDNNLWKFLTRNNSSPPPHSSWYTWFMDDLNHKGAIVVQSSNHIAFVTNESNIAIAEILKNRKKN